jgi:hypothetical protein
VKAVKKDDNSFTWFTEEPAAAEAKAKAAFSVIGCFFFDYDGARATE